MKNVITSPEYKKYLRKEKNKKWIIIASQIGLLVLIIGLWELLTRVGAIDTFITSSPSKIAETIYSIAVSGELWLHISTTLWEALLGFVIATLGGTLIAILLWFSETARKILDPFLVVLNSLPKIALGPLIIIWVGIGTGSIVMIDVLIMIVITTLTMLGSYTSCDKSKLMLMQSYGANKIQTLTKLIIPNSICEFIGVLKVNVGLTWVGTIMGEYLNSRAGLGYLIVYGGQVFNLNLVMASTVILCILAGIMYFAVAQFEKVIRKKFNARQ